MSLELLARRWREEIDEYEEKVTNDVKQVVVETVKEKVEQYSSGFITVDDVWEDVLAKLDTNQFYAISAVGSQGSGKSSLALEFVEKALLSGFRFLYALVEDFMDNIEGWIDKVLENPSEKYVFVGDDLSYSNDAVSRKKSALFKNFIARIRHRLSKFARENNKTVQVLVIYVTHRLHAAPPILRNSGSWIFTEMQSADRDDALEVIGKNKDLRERLDVIYSFLNETVFEGAKKGIIEFILEGKPYSFRWGKQDNPGDGRLMCIYHAGKLNIYNSKLPKTEIDVDKYRIIPDVIED